MTPVKALVKVPELIVPSPRERRLDPELELIAHWMDTAFRVPGLGIRFGFDAIIGLVPGFGDMITTFISLYLLGAARRYGVPRATLFRMASNIAIDSLVGSIPFLGDAFDVYWKANQKNIVLLRKHVLATPEEQRRARRGDSLFMAGLILGLLAILVVTFAGCYYLISRLFTH